LSKHAFIETRIPIEQDNPSIMRHEELCVKCGNCRRICEGDIAVGKLYDLEKTGDKAICIHCGQCALVCPVNSITERPEYHAVKAAIADPDKIVIINTSPSVRVGIGEEFGFAPGSFLEGKMVSALRALGADYVLDTNFSADLTITEEAAELVERVTMQKKPLPQFTSCCPAWVKFVETFYPEILPHISSSKSPIGMQGPTVKTWFAKEHGIDPRKIVNVALTPCTAKKFEIRREEMNASAGYFGIDDLRDMDYVVTTRELANWIREDGIDFGALDDCKYDDAMGAASGAGLIFGNTGGVMEAAARTAYYYITGKKAPDSFYKLEPVRGMEGIKKADVEIGGVRLHLAVVYGTDNAKTIIEEYKQGKTDGPLSEGFDFIEVMTCKGGCIGGGGQPKTEIPITNEILSARIAGLYSKDETSAVRCSHDNPQIQKVYKTFYDKPLSPLAKKMLHTTYHSRAEDLGV
jgi:ferredoxin hydrogenase